MNSSAKKLAPQPLRASCREVEIWLPKMVKDSSLLSDWQYMRLQIHLGLHPNYIGCSTCQAEFVKLSKDARTPTS